MLTTLYILLSLMVGWSAGFYFRHKIGAEIPTLVSEFTILHEHLNKAIDDAKDMANKIASDIAKHEADLKRVETAHFTGLSKISTQLARREQ